MRAEVANIALQFLQRVDLKGSEASTLAVVQQELTAVAQGQMIMQPVATEKAAPGTLPAPRTQAQVELEKLRSEYDEYKKNESDRIETLLGDYIAKLWRDSSADRVQLRSIFGADRVRKSFMANGIIVGDEVGVAEDAEG